MRLSDLLVDKRVVVKPNKGKPNLVGKSGVIMGWRLRRQGALVDVKLDVIGCRTLPSSLLEVV